jgi:hypothetical protein
MFIPSSPSNTSRPKSQAVQQFGAKVELPVTRQSKKHASKIHHSQIEVDRSEDKPDGFDLTTNPKQARLNDLYYTLPTDIKTMELKPHSSKPNKGDAYIELEPDEQILEKSGWTLRRNYNKEKTSQPPTSLNVTTRGSESITYGKSYEPANTVTIQSDQGIQHRQELASLRSITRSPGRRHFETTFTDPSNQRRLTRRYSIPSLARLKPPSTLPVRTKNLDGSVNYSGVPIDANSVTIHSGEERRYQQELGPLKSVTFDSNKAHFDTTFDHPVDGTSLTRRYPVSPGELVYTPTTLPVRTKHLDNSITYNNECDAAKTLTLVSPTGTTYEQILGRPKSLWRSVSRNRFQTTFKTPNGIESREEQTTPETNITGPSDLYRNIHIHDDGSTSVFRVDRPPSPRLGHTRLAAVRRSRSERNIKTTLQDRSEQHYSGVDSEGRSLTLSYSPIGENLFVHTNAAVTWHSDGFTPPSSPMLTPTDLPDGAVVSIKTKPDAKDIEIMNKEGNSIGGLVHSMSTNLSKLRYPQYLTEEHEHRNGDTSYFAPGYPPLFSDTESSGSSSDSFNPSRPKKRTTRKRRASRTRHTRHYRQH